MRTCFGERWLENQSIKSVLFCKPIHEGSEWDNTKHTLFPCFLRYYWEDLLCCFFCTMLITRSGSSAPLSGSLLAFWRQQGRESRGGRERRAEHLYTVYVSAILGLAKMGSERNRENFEQRESRRGNNKGWWWKCCSVADGVIKGRAPSAFAENLEWNTQLSSVSTGTLLLESSYSSKSPFQSLTDTQVRR